MGRAVRCVKAQSSGSVLTNLGPDGVPLDVVREALGHSDLSTTTVYLTSSLARRVRESARLA